MTSPTTVKNDVAASLDSLVVTGWTLLQDELAARRLDQLEWYFADLGGAHLVATLPAEQPHATHLWGWGSDVRVRIRLDRGTAWLSILRLTDSGRLIARRGTPSQWTVKDNAVRLEDSFGDELAGRTLETLCVDTASGVLQLHAVLVRSSR